MLNNIQHLFFKKKASHMNKDTRKRVIDLIPEQQTCTQKNKRDCNVDDIIPDSQDDNDKKISKLSQPPTILLKMESHYIFFSDEILPAALQDLVTTAIEECMALDLLTYDHKGPRGTNNRGSGVFSDKVPGFYYANEQHASQRLRKLAPVLEGVNALKRTSFNAIVVQHYRGPLDCIGQHSHAPTCSAKDDQGVAMIATGVERDFVIMRKSQTEKGDEQERAAVRYVFPSKHMHLYHMSPGFQKYYTHGKPRRAAVRGSHVTLTFRFHDNT
jgi:hypothetical protein